MFIFQNNFWVNLHQFLRGEIYRRGANLPLGIDPMSLSEMDRTAWESAIEVYVDGRQGRSGLRRESAADCEHALNGW
jgi:hypothetical protein